MVSYDMEKIGFINLFEKETGAEVKDCFYSDNALIFVVNEGNIARAVGKQGSNVRRISYALKKQVKVLEFNIDPVKFVASLLYPIKPAKITREDAIVTIKAHDTAEKGRIFGREKTNLRRVQEIVSKYFPVQLKVE